MFIAYSFPLPSLTKPSHIRELVGRWTHHEEGKGGHGEVHENCMNPTLPLIQTSHTVHASNTEDNSTQHEHHNPHTPGEKSFIEQN